MGFGQWSVIQRFKQPLKPKAHRTGGRGLKVTELGFWTGLLLGVWFLSGFLPLSTGGGRDVVLAGIALTLWAIADRTILGAILAVATALIGTAVELFMVDQGTFFYLPEHSNLKAGFSGGVPTWLPSLYCVASLCASQIAARLISEGSEGSGMRSATPSADSR